MLKGRVRRRDDTMQLQAMEVSIPDLSSTTESPMLVTLPSSRCIESVLERLRETLKTHPGKSEVRLKVTSPGRATVLKLDDRLRVEKNPALYGELKALLGASCLN